MNSEERVKRAFHFERPNHIPMSCMNLKTNFFPISQFQPRVWEPEYYPPHVQGGVINLIK